MVKWPILIGIHYVNYHIIIICHAAKIIKNSIQYISQFGHIMESHEIMSAFPE